MHGIPGGQGNGYRTGDSTMDSRRKDSCHSAATGLDRKTVRRLIRLAEKAGPEGRRPSDGRTSLEEKAKHSRIRFIVRGH